MTPTDYTPLSAVMPRPVKRRRRWPLWTALAVVLLAAAGAAVYLLLPGKIVIHGDLRLYADSDALQDGAGSCTGHGGFSDIHAGTQVTVTGPDGTVLGFGTLGKGDLENSNTCLFTFTAEVPAGEASYGFSTSTQRGVIRFTEADMLADGVHLTYGG